MPDEKTFPTGSRRKRIQHYALSLPERVLRSLAALAGGLAHELSSVVLPPALRRTRLYRTMVEALLRFLVENVGEVEGVFEDGGELSRDFLLRRTAGNGIEALGILAFRASPVWVLAALADLSGASRVVFREIAASLEEAGLLKAGGSFETVDQILDGLEQTAGQLAESINTPPLDLPSLRREWRQTQQAFAKIPAAFRPSSEAVQQAWEQLRATAREQQRPVHEISSLIAIRSLRSLPNTSLSLGRSAAFAARRGGAIFAGNILDHYRDVLCELRQVGYSAFVARELGPYLEAALRHFRPSKVSSLEQWLRRN